MNSNFSEILRRIIISDAVGAAFEGIKRTQIKSQRINLTGFVDISKLKKFDTAKRIIPGLYTSISQLLILFTMNASKEFPNIKKLSESLHDENVKTEMFLRNADIAENFFFSNFSKLTVSQPSARIPLALSSLAATVSGKSLFTESFSCEQFTSNYHTLVGTALYIQALYHILNILNNEGNSYSSAIEALLQISEDLCNTVSNYSAEIFSLGKNPDTFLQNCALYKDIFVKLNKTMPNTPEKAESVICEIINPTIKTPIKHCNVNNPIFQIPYAAFLADYFNKISETIFFKVPLEGGYSSSLTCYSAIFDLFLAVPKPIPSILVDNLINKKEISAFIEIIAADKKFKLTIPDFFKSETQLTLKSNEENLSLNKCLHFIPQKNKKSNIKNKNEENLAKHIVESWTKIDKAKWRKNLEKSDKKSDFNQ